MSSEFTSSRALHTTLSYHPLLYTLPWHKHWKQIKKNSFQLKLSLYTHDSRELHVKIHCIIIKYLHHTYIANICECQLYKSLSLLIHTLHTPWAITPGASYYAIPLHLHPLTYINPHVHTLHSHVLYLHTHTFAHPKVMNFIISPHGHFPPKTFTRASLNLSYSHI